jgi:hypothetical protein
MPSPGSTPATKRPRYRTTAPKHLDVVSNRMRGIDGFSDGALIVPDALRCNGFVSPK